MMQKESKALDTMQRELQKLKESKVSLLKQQKTLFNELQKMKKEQAAAEDVGREEAAAAAAAADERAQVRARQEGAHHRPPRQGDRPHGDEASDLRGPHHLCNDKIS
jgi:aspartate oxidase